MILEIKVPSPGESISEVEIASWLVEDGDYVEKNQPIAELDSDKATLELPSEESGLITLKAEEGDVVAVNEVICLIDTEAVKQKENQPTIEVKETKKEEIKIKSEVSSKIDTYASGTVSPAAKKIIAEKNIDSSTVKGTGKDGRITKQDVLSVEQPFIQTQQKDLHRGIERKKMSMLRRKIAQRLVSVKNETAMLTTFNEINMQPIFDIRKKYKEDFKEKHGAGLGFMSFFTLAVVRGLKMFPDINSMIDGDYQIVNEFKDISIAVSGPKGLMVPVIRNAEKLTFRGVESEVKRLAIKARDGQITVDEMTGGTFTITNGGIFGSMLSTPILNPPQSAILGMHNIVNRPMAVNGQVVIQPIMYVALSYDHRIIDGKESVGFLVSLKEALENPVELLMDGNLKVALEM